MMPRSGPGSQSITEFVGHSVRLDHVGPKHRGRCDRRAQSNCRTGRRV